MESVHFLGGSHCKVPLARQGSDRALGAGLPKIRFSRLFNCVWFFIGPHKKNETHHGAVLYINPSENRMGATFILFMGTDKKPHNWESLQNGKTMAPGPISRQGHPCRDRLGTNPPRPQAVPNLLKGNGIPITCFFPTFIFLSFFLAGPASLYVASVSYSVRS